MLLSSTWMKTKLILSCWKITSLKLGWIAISKYQLAKLHEETSLCYKKLQLSQKIFLIDLLTFIDKICQNREKALTKDWLWGSQREHTIKSTGSLITMFVTQKHQFICSTSNVEIIKKGSTWRYHVKGKISGTIQRCNSSPVLYLKLLIHRGKMPLDPISQDGVSIPCPLKNWFFFQSSFPLNIFLSRNSTHYEE